MSEEPPFADPIFQDPRLRGFRSRTSVEEVVALIDARTGILDSEEVPLREAAGRVLSKNVRAGFAVPPFDRAAMDGYAVRGEETFGADPYTPASFRVVGVSRPGRRFDGQVQIGEAVEIATGAPIPGGADTVVPVENTTVEGGIVRVVEATPPGRHVGQRGEDLQAGDDVLPAGRTLRPQDLGLLSALGLSTIPVVRRPNVTILITGDELLPPATLPRDDRFADMNSPMVAALVNRDGGSPRVIGPLDDDRDALELTLRSTLAESNLVLISGGSSTGPEDHAPGLVAKLGTLNVHGVALRPASPTGLGFVGDVPIVLLPGNPVSCLCAYDLFAGRIIRRLGSRSLDWPYRAVERPLRYKLSSVVGRVDYARVRLVGDSVEPLATSGASILSSTTRADGFVMVPADLEGYPAGALIRVWLYDP